MSFANVLKIQRKHRSSNAEYRWRTRPAGELVLVLLSLLGSAAPPVSAAVFDACGSISTDTTWTTGNVYTVRDCNLVVEAAATLTVQPGVIVKIGGVAPNYGSGAGSAAIIVDGTLDAVGSSAQPVRFSSIADDSLGGDNNQDGSSVGAAGDWWGLLFRSGAHVRLQHFFVGYAGSGVFNGAIGYNRAQVDVRTADVRLLDGEIATGSRKGVYLEGDGITPTLQRLTIRDNRGGSGGDRGYPVYQASLNMQPSYADLNLSGNDHDRVFIYQWFGSLGQDVVLSGAHFTPGCGYTSCQLTVPDGRRLTIAPGTTIDFSDPSYGNSPFGIIVASGGSLIAEGTVAEPVTLTSNLAAAGQSAYHWDGIRAQDGSTLRLDHCDIGWSGGYYGNSPALTLETNNAQVRNCAFHHSSSDGLYVNAPAQTTRDLALENLQIVDNAQFGLNLIASFGSHLVFSLDGGDIARNGRAGADSYTYYSSMQLSLANLTVASNGQSGDPADPRLSAGLNLNQHNIDLHLQDVEFLDNPNAAVYWYCNGSLSGNGLTATGNGRNAIVLPRCDVYAGRQWDFANAGMEFQVDGLVTVTDNSFLSIQPGTSLRFSPGQGMALSGGSLYALGNGAAPIRFLGSVEQSGHWRGISMHGANASLYLSNCEIAHAGSDASYYSSALLIGSVLRAAVVQNCRIHHNTIGVTAQTGALVLSNNEITDNTQFGVQHGGYTAAYVDARNNWWGVASGPYHATLNPTGEGNAVGDYVLFEPWLTAPPAPGTLVVDQVLVSTGSPDLVSPGQTVDYAVQYINLRSTAVTNSLVVMQLPQAAEYIASSHGGTYWPERDQVIWRLGDIAAGSSGALTATLRFAWGLPRGYRDSSLTLFSADNYQSDVFSPEDRASYTALDLANVQDHTLLSALEYSAERSSYAALDTQHSQAEAAGYQFHSAARVHRSDGANVTVAAFIHPGNRSVRLLARSNQVVYTMGFTADAVSIENASGGMRLIMDSGEQQAWGDWSDSAALFDAELLKAPTCTYESCRSKCRLQLAGLTYLAKKIVRVFAWSSIGLLSGGTGAAGVVYEVGSLALDYQSCDLDCFADPNKHCCTAGQIKWSNGGGLIAANACFKSTCSPVGTWIPSGAKYCVQFGERCVASVDGIGCVPCSEVSPDKFSQDPFSPLIPAAALEACVAGKAVSGGRPRCRDLALFVAKDPNEIVGPAGDLLPGQTVTYTVRYENEGEGRAYGVYIVNDLPTELDENSLVIDNGGWYVAASRQLVWLVGELGPAGADDAEGAVGYTADVKTGLPSGTPIANRAVVFFPSVPEETPTNTWVNQIQPLAAIPQSLDTSYATPLNITLAGREVSDLPLTFAIDEAPLRGQLTGTPPDLSYTPADDVVGEDSFSFTVNNGSSTSRPASVLIRIAATGDIATPSVLAVTPDAGATLVAVAADPLILDDSGAQYPPIIVIAVSEALDPDSINADRVTLEGPDGAVPASVRFDGSGNRILLIPRAALAGEAMHSVRVLAGITDMAGNPLAPYSWEFSTATAPAATPVQIFHDGFETATPATAR